MIKKAIINEDLIEKCYLGTLSKNHLEAENQLLSHYKDLWR